MKRQKLAVEKRTVLGKKVKKLRKEGILPANVYGKDIKSLAVQLPYKEFEKTYKEVGETGLIDVEVDGKAQPVLIHNVQFNHLTRQPLHADFYQVNLKEKVKTMVPLVLIGEAKAVADKVGLVLQPVSEVEVEALPEALPEKIEINVEPLAVIDEQIAVKDIKLPQGVTVLTDPEQVVVKIGELVTKEAQEEAAAAAAVAEAAKAEAGAAAAVAEEVAKPAAEREKSAETPKETPKTEEKTQ